MGKSSEIRNEARLDVLSQMSKRYKLPERELMDLLNKGSNDSFTEEDVKKMRSDRDYGNKFTTSEMLEDAKFESNEKLTDALVGMSRLIPKIGNIIDQFSEKTSEMDTTMDRTNQRMKELEKSIDNLTDIIAKLVRLKENGY